MEDIIQFLEENQKSEASGTKETIYVNSSEGLGSYAYKDEEYTEKYSKEQLIKAYEQGAMVRIYKETGMYVAKPICLVYPTDEVISMCGDAVSMIINIGEIMVIASKEYVEPEIG